MRESGLEPNGISNGIKVIPLTRQNGDKSNGSIIEDPRKSSQLNKSQEITQSDPSVLTPTCKVNSNAKHNPHSSVRTTRTKLTLQEYRKQVGLKIGLQKHNQKIGIKAKCESPVEDKTVVSNPSETKVSCPHCGNSLKDALGKCHRCMRAFEKETMVRQLHHVSAQSESKYSEIPLLSKEPFTYGNRRPRTQNGQPSRPAREKFGEPQCVTLSSDEDDDFMQETKKLKSVDSPCELTIGTPKIPLPPNNEEHASSSIPSSPAMGNSTESQANIDRWKEGGFKGNFLAVHCRSVRIGSYKFTPRDKVLLSSEAILLQAPCFDSHKWQSKSPASINSWIGVTIPGDKLLKVQVHFTKKLPVIFVNVTPTCSKAVSKEIGLTKNSKNEPYWDAISENDKERILTLLPFGLDDFSKHAIKEAFVNKGVFEEIDYDQANKILVKCSPLTESEASASRLPSSTVCVPASPFLRNSAASKENMKKNEMRLTRSVSRSAVFANVVPMFSWPDGPDRFSVTTEDYNCLNLDNLLNDSIIDFYLRYVFSTKLNNVLKEKCHVFSSFFYQRLTSRPPKVTGRKHPIEDDCNLLMKHKRHSRVKSWTKKVNIFEKDYLVIPINERSHWFLAIVCFPGLSGPMSVRDNTPIKLEPYSSVKKTPKACNKVTIDGISYNIGNTTITAVPSNAKEANKNVPVTLSIDTDRDEAETDEEEDVILTPKSCFQKSMEITEPIKQPCILFFDSLAGSSHNRVAATLREYLMVEYQTKECKADQNEELDAHTKKLFSKENVVSACLEVPQQNNSYDCGVYVLQYAESFMKKPFEDYNIPKLNLANWFPSYMAGRKRKNIQFLLIQLAKEMNPEAQSVLDLLPSEDVRIALQERRKPSPAATINMENGDVEVPSTDSKTLFVVMANEEHSNAKNNGEEDVVSTDSVLDQEENIQIDE